MRFLNRYKHSIFLAVLTATSYVLGYLRDKIFAHYYGLSTTLDIYHASFIIPDTVMNLFLAGAMVSVLVPFMNSFKDHAERDRTLGVVLQAGLLLNIIVCIGVFFAMPVLVPLVVDQPEIIPEVVFYSRVLLLSPLIFLISNFLGGILVNRRSLAFYGASPILYNIGIIAGVIVLHAQGILGIILGALLGALAHLGIRALGVWRQKEKIYIRFTNWTGLKTSLRGPLPAFFRLALPKMLSLTTLHINYWLFTYFASKEATEGSIFALNIARNFYNVPISVITIALATDAFAVLSKQYSEKKTAGFLKELRHYGWLIAVSGLFFGLFYYFLSPYFIALLLKGGKFDHEAVVFTARLISFFGLVIFFESLMQYFARVLHAMGDTFWQMISQLTCLMITLILLFSTFENMGMIAIPVSFSAGMLVQNVVQISVIRTKLGRLSQKTDISIGGSPA